MIVMILHLQATRKNKKKKVKFNQKKTLKKKKMNKRNTSMEHFDCSMKLLHFFSLSLMHQQSLH